MKPRRWKNRRPPIDREAERYYIYRLFDAAGTCLYVGRSCNPLNRLKDHHATTEWAAEVVEIDARGPYTWDEACRVERETIYAERPAHNRMFILTHTRPPVSLP